jgi:uncharacterized delta-60 repeat protein
MIGAAQEWAVRYNGPGNGHDIAYALAIDNAGNICVTGWSWRAGVGYEYATLKYDALGVEQWVARYGGPTDRDNTWDYAYAVAVDNASNVYVTGGSQGLSTGRDFATLKYNSSGTEQWVARYNGPANGLDEANAIAVDSVGNVYVTGKSAGTGTAYDYATIKYDSLGFEQWVARYDGPSNGWDFANALAVDILGNVYVTGWSAGFGTGYDYATIKYDSLGIEQWATRYTSPGIGDDCASALAVDDFGNVYITGWSEGTNSGYDYATVKYDSTGDEQWAARYCGPTDNQEKAYALAVDDIGNVYVTGWSEGPGTYYDYATVRYYFSGDLHWDARYDGTASNFDYARALAIDDAGNVYVTGWSKGINTDYDYATVVYDSFGVQQWTARYDGPSNDADQAYAVAVDNAGNVYVTGCSEGIGSSYDYATIRYSGVGIEEEAELKLHDKMYSLRLYPNPFTHRTQIRYRIHDAGYTEQEFRNSNFEMRKPTMKIYDAAGRLVKYFDLESCILDRASTISWDGTDQASRQLGSGVYFLKFETEDYSATEPLVLIR